MCLPSAFVGSWFVRLEDCRGEEPLKQGPPLFALSVRKITRPCENDHIDFVEASNTLRS